MRQAWLCLFIAVFIIGCAGHPIPPPATGDLHFTNGIYTAASHDAVLGLGKRLSIRVAANSWSELVAQTKPTFAWNGCDLLWIKDDGPSHTEFTMDEANWFSPDDKSAQLVLLDFTPIRTEYDPEAQSVILHNFHATAVSDGKVPKKYYDYDRPGNYAIVLSKNRRYGTVYEIGWGRITHTGRTRYNFGRRIYLFRDNLARWHFLEEGAERGGAGRSAWVDCTAKVVWEKWRPDKIPLHLEYVPEVMILKGSSIRDIKLSPGKDVISTEDFGP